MIDPNEFLNIIKSRRSIRKFLDVPVPDSDIEKILTAASWAPSGTNHQNWHFIIVRSKDLKNKMVEVVIEAVKKISDEIKIESAKRGFLNYTTYFTFFKNAPLVIAVVKKPYESVTKKLMRRYELTQGHLSTTDVQGPAAAIQNLLLMAHALGYGSCWMTGPMIAKRNLEELLGINEPDELLALIPIGKPAVIPGAPKRKSIKGIVTYK